jgi:transposase
MALCKALHKFFRVLKTDLDLRPIYHQKDENTMAHLHLGLLAYWLINTVRHQLKKKRYSQWLAGDRTNHEHTKSSDDFSPKQSRRSDYDTPLFGAKWAGPKTL